MGLVCKSEDAAAFGRDPSLPCLEVWAPQSKLFLIMKKKRGFCWFKSLNELSPGSERCHWGMGEVMDIGGCGKARSALCSSHIPLNHLGYHLKLHQHRLKGLSPISPAKMCHHGSKHSLDRSQSIYTLCPTCKHLGAGAVFRPALGAGPFSEPSLICSLTNIPVGRRASLFHPFPTPSQTTAPRSPWRGA